MEIQLDPRGVRIRTTAGWRSFAPTDSVESIISALIADRQHAAFIPTDGLGTATTRADASDDINVGTRQSTIHTATGTLRKSAPGARLVRVMPADPKLRRPKRRASPTMTLDELFAN